MSELDPEPKELFSAPQHWFLIETGEVSTGIFYWRCWLKTLKTETVFKAEYWILDADEPGQSHEKRIKYVKFLSNELISPKILMK
jgi:hypothetical protein